AADPATPLGALPLLPAAERTTLLEQFNATRHPLPAAPTIPALLAQQVARTPHAVALRAADATLTYAELDVRANRLAHLLIAHGAAPDTLVAVALPRTADLIVALLAVLKAGAAYLPIDLAYPAERVAFMLRDSQAPLLITTAALALPSGPWRTLDLAALDETLAAAPPTPPAPPLAPHHLAYLIYTSGSTGVPKGVAIEQRATLALLGWARRVFRDDELQGVLAATSVCFDLSIFEIFAPLAWGGTVILADDALALATLPARPLVTLLNTVPSAAAALLALGGIPPAVRTTVLAGEPLPTALVDQLYALGHIERVLDCYGPTEDTTYSTWAVRTAGAAATIGVPLDNTQVAMVDARGALVPIGVPGELVLLGAGLARGYLGRPELTAEKFVQLGGLGPTPRRAYRTGDRARWRADGQIEYLGRIDQQVKIRGFRIEPGEIEAVVRSHPGVAEVAVVPWPRSDGMRLVAYVVGHGTPPGVSELRAQVQARLPEYMIPARFIALAALPQTPNGKLDRKALPDPAMVGEADGMPGSRSGRAPQSAVEAELARIWADVLRLRQVGIDDNFFELGGDSILSIQIIARAAQAGLRITPRQIFQHQTIAALATTVTRVAAGGSQGLAQGSAPLTPIQRWFFALDLPQPQHWNQAILLELRQPIRDSILARAVAQLLIQHDALRMRFTRSNDGWRQQYGTPDARVPLARHDLAALDAAAQDAAMAAIAERTQADLDLAEGLPVRFVRFHLGPQRPSRLLIVIHHLVVDGVSWQILLADLQHACKQIAAGEQPNLPAKTSSFREWAERLVEHARRPALLAQLDYWQTHAAADPALPRDMAAAPDTNREADAEIVSVALNADDTRALLTLVPAAYRTR
ncbi:MAG TPA: amino acid adenylation domain-containing protein, partial [Roseiflexaceae bacterium]|nr:amino acid adenylation domain-containing protein [Roseiflexaceae bacterium]